jgi:hypothetical protein
MPFAQDCLRATAPRARSSRCCGVPGTCEAWSLSSHCHTRLGHVGRTSQYNEEVLAPKWRTGMVTPGHRGPRTKPVDRCSLVQLSIRSRPADAHQLGCRRLHTFARESCSRVHAWRLSREAMWWKPASLILPLTNADSRHGHCRKHDENAFPDE